MYIRKKNKYGKPVKIIQAGEFYVSKSDEFIETLLGSCVAVCLHDDVTGISGMNHFMLPGRISKADIFEDRTARYGIIAINELLSEMIEIGAIRDNIVAKVFGGGNVFEFEKQVNTIPHDNVRLARVMLELEDIPISELDVGESFTRKLMMDVKSGKVYLRKTTNREVLERIYQEEMEYAKRGFNK